MAIPALIKIVLLSLLIVFSHQQVADISGKIEGRLCEHRQLQQGIEVAKTIIILIVVFSFVGAIVLVVILCLFVPRCCTWMQQKNQFEKYRLKYNERRRDSVNSQLQNEILRKFMSFLFDVKQKKRFFYFERNNNRREVVLDQIESAKTENNEVQIQLRGEDYLGKWKAKGSFITTTERPFFWMLKFYDDKKSAGQTGEFHTLVYESTDIRQGEVEGRWFYEGMETSAEYSGAWRIGSLELASAERILSDNVS